MAIVEQEVVGPAGALCDRDADRVPKERYYDPDFYRLEAELLWPRVWQMACRLEEIPQPGDFAEYEILDQSVLVVRAEDMGVRAFDNVCRHRGVRFAQGRGSKPRRLRLPVPRLVLRHRRPEHPRHPGGRRSPSTTSSRPSSTSSPVRCETWGGCAWINLDADAPPLRDVPWSPSPPCSTPGRWSRCGPSGGTPPASRSTGSSAWRPSSSSTTCSQSHPQLRIPGRYPGRDAVRPAGVPRLGAAVPADDERRHGGHGPRPRPRDRRGDGGPGAARRLQAGAGATWDRTPQRRGRHRRTAPRAATCPT